MENKQIIIDGVDVSECEYRDWRNFCHCDNSKENEGEKRITGRCGCKYNPNCYYKQLKRKEQECKELKEQLSVAQERYATMRPHAIELADTKLKLQKEVNTLNQTLDDIKDLINKAR